MGQKKFDREEARKLMEAGWNNVMIAEKFGVNPKSIREYRHKIGLPPSTTKRERKDAKPGRKAQKPPVIPVERITTFAKEAIYPTCDGNKKCRTCVYRMYAPPYTVCGFILATGYSRALLGIPSGDKCTVYIKGNPEDIVWKTM